MDGRELGLPLGSALTEGNVDGMRVGSTDSDGEDDVVGEADGTEVGEDDVDGLRLTDGALDGVLPDSKRHERDKYEVSHGL